MLIINDISAEQNIGIGIALPLARLHLAAGTDVANTAPIKLISGAALSAVEDGAVEYYGNQEYITIVTEKATTERHPLTDGTDVTTVSNTTTTLSSTSKTTQIFIGTVDRQVINLGLATQYNPNHRFLIINDSQTVLGIVNYSGISQYRLSPYESAEFFVRDNTTNDGIWTLKTTPVQSKKNVFRQYTDWATSSELGEKVWATVTSSGTNTQLTVPQNNTVGVVRHATSAANGRACLHQGISTMFFGGGVVIWEARVRFPTLSTAAQSCFVQLGFGDNTGSGWNTKGVYFNYWYNDSGWAGGDGNFWICETAVGGYSTLNTSSPIAANTWYRIRIEINRDGTLAQFFVDDVLIGERTAIPNTSANVFSLVNKIQKDAGSNAISMDIDYVDVAMYFNTERG